MKIASNGGGSSRSRHNMLSRIPINELKKLQVSINRENIVTPVPAGPIQLPRRIIDPKQIVPLVHIWPGRGAISIGIFDRHDILINQEDVFSLIEADKADPHKFHGLVTYNRSHSRTTNTRSLSRTSDRGRHKKGDRGRDSGDARRSVEKDRELNRDRDERPYKGRPHSRKREEGGYRKRSRTPIRPGEYRPSHSDVRRRSGSRGRDRSGDRYRTHSRNRSLSADCRKPSTSRKSSRSPRRFVSPSRDKGRPKSPRYSPPRRSQSPSKPDKSHYGDRRGRDPSPGYKDSCKRRSRSPWRYDREKRRSKSPHTRSSPGRYNRYSSRRCSHSPGVYDRYPSSDKPCTSSPRPPIATFSETKSNHRRSSKSQEYERDRANHHSRHRSRSRSPRRSRRSRSTHADRETNYYYYEGMPGAKHWIPGLIQPGLPAIPYYYYPPAFFPRIPMMPPYVAPEGQRPPVYNSKRRPVNLTNPGPPGCEGAMSATGGGGETQSATSGDQAQQLNVEVRDASDSDNNTEQKNMEES